MSNLSPPASCGFFVYTRSLVFPTFGNFIHPTRFTPLPYGARQAKCHRESISFSRMTNDRNCHDGLSLTVEAEGSWRQKRELKSRGAALVKRIYQFPLLWSEW